MAADALAFYYNFLETVADNSIDLDGDTFNVLLTSSSYTPNQSTHTQLSDITNELSGNGYSRQALTSVTWTQSGGTATFDAANTAWTASGGSITARYAVIYSDTSTNDLLVGYILLDNSPADVTVTDGNTLTLAWNASGILTVA